MEAVSVKEVPRRVAGTGGRGGATWTSDEPVSRVDGGHRLPEWRRLVVTGNGNPRSPGGIETTTSTLPSILEDTLTTPLRPVFAAFVAVSALISVAGGAIAIGSIAGDLPAPVILIDDTGMLGLVGPHAVAQDQYVPMSDDPYHTGDAYSTGASPLARQAWLPSPAVTAVLFV